MVRRGGGEAKTSLPAFRGRADARRSPDAGRVHALIRDDARRRPSLAGCSDESVYTLWFAMMLADAPALYPPRSW